VVFEVAASCGSEVGGVMIGIRWWEVIELVAAGGEGYCVG